jgi:hypothetical protein
MIWWLIGLGGAFWAYQNGLGAWVGACPPGYTAGSDMFPVCRNTLLNNAWPAGQTPTGPALPAGQEYAWNNSTWVAVNTYPPRWP